MSKLKFFTPVTYTTPPKSIGSSLLKKVDAYFYLGGKKAYVIEGRTKNGQEKAVLSKAQTSLLAKTGKILSYHTLIIPLIMLVAKVALRSTHSFKLIDPQKKLEKGLDIPKDTADKIQELLPKILKSKDDKEIQWISKRRNLIFKLTHEPELVFKIGNPRFLRYDRSRFRNMVKAKEICLANELGLLIIPNAKRLIVTTGGNKHIFVVEKCLDLNPNESANEEFYHQYSKELNEAVRQLATFIAKTGFNDVTWRNIPFLKETEELHSSRRIALIDLEDMESAANGFIGDLNSSRGLIRCVSKEQIDLVVAEMRRQGVRISKKEILEIKNMRLQEIESDKKLHEFYGKKGITGREPIQVDLGSLGLNLAEEGQVVIFDEDKIKWEEQIVSLGKAAQDIVTEINRLIEASPDLASLKGKRYICLSTQGLSLIRAYDIARGNGKYLEWLPQIIDALAAKGYIFSLDHSNGYGYYIQA